MIDANTESLCTHIISIQPLFISPAFSKPPHTSTHILPGRERRPIYTQDSPIRLTHEHSGGCIFLSVCQRKNNTLSNFNDQLRTFTHQLLKTHPQVIWWKRNVEKQWTFRGRKMKNFSKHKFGETQVWRRHNKGFRLTGRWTDTQLFGSSSEVFLNIPSALFPYTLDLMIPPNVTATISLSFLCFLLLLTLRFW